MTLIFHRPPVKQPVYGTRLLVFKDEVLIGTVRRSLTLPYEWAFSTTHEGSALGYRMKDASRLSNLREQLNGMK